MTNSALANCVHFLMVYLIQTNYSQGANLFFPKFSEHKLKLRFRTFVWNAICDDGNNAIQ
uniref:Uncharacterized protein n=1 Tax=Glossina morsitans morsitans TaxID=37546 RepID=A0A1B0GDD4_GLOMM